ncbi:coproporphyrinogen III oxidase [Bacillus fonticola]|uniref:coproporphyrinogen III oxidase n=1 Tax=Bacillus fonticola TaxID=2728853 RepID=UPI0014740EF0|nr:coproporphyrinogen III oxidase [Bacillus fonticola]
MNITICGLPNPKYERAVQRVVDLFYEDTKVVEQQADLTITFEVKLSSVRVTLDDEHSIVGKEAFPLKAEEDQVKKACLRALLVALEQKTGMKQKWGILTGVRPTKLVHKASEAGEDKEIISDRLQEEQKLHPEKIDLLHRIVSTQQKAIPDLYKLKKEVSIYIGIPFCPTKCAYCTFPAYAIQGKQGNVNAFLHGLHVEMERTGEWLREHGIGITTIYFGGGTPTSITAEEMDALYEHMYKVFPNMDKVREVTVEAGRPDTITVEKLRVLKKWGIDRISVNPQSYTQATLKAIGRHHTVEETIEKYHLAREMGMTNINMDLIIGLPNETVETFEHSLAKTAELMPESLTVHTLSFKRASHMSQNRDRYKVASRDEVMRMMKTAEAWAEPHGYKPYYLYRQKNILGNLENVGYAQPGQESLYNILIMEELQTIIGLGCGASSKWVHPVTGAISRFANPKEPRAYALGFEAYTEKKLQQMQQLFFGQNTTT